MGVMSILNTLGSGISHLSLHPHGDVSHLGGATTQTSSTQGAAWDDSSWMDWTTWLSWWTVRQSDCRFTFCAVALGQSLQDSGATLKAFLSRRQVDALQSKQRDSGWHFIGHSCCDGMPTHYSWRVVCVVCVVCVVFHKTRGVSLLWLCVHYCYTALTVFLLVTVSLLQQLHFIPALHQNLTSTSECVNKNGALPDWGHK